MAPSRRRGANKAKNKTQLSLGDLVLAKVKGHPFWPAKVRFIIQFCFVSYTDSASPCTSICFAFYMLLSCLLMCVLYFDK